jgi:uncharacterized membrane-anchored protein YhcB (DUF1043 family)
MSQTSVILIALLAVFIAFTIFDLIRARRVQGKAHQDSVESMREIRQRSDAYQEKIYSHMSEQSDLLRQILEELRAQRPR